MYLDADIIIPGTITIGCEISRENIEVFTMVHKIQPKPYLLCWELLFQSWNQSVEQRHQNCHFRFPHFHQTKQNYITCNFLYPVWQFLEIDLCERTQIITEKKVKTSFFEVAKLSDGLCKLWARFKLTIRSTHSRATSATETVFDHWLDSS